MTDSTFVRLQSCVVKLGKQKVRTTLQLSILDHGPFQHRSLMVTGQVQVGAVIRDFKGCAPLGLSESAQYGIELRTVARALAQGIRQWVRPVDDRPDPLARRCRERAAGIPLAEVLGHDLLW
jgi:hypothetical protein